MKSSEDLLEELIEEGIMDWLFSRWRRGGRWKGGGGASGGELQDLQKTLQAMYGSMGPLQKSFPQATRRIRGNIRRIMVDLENINMLISKGVDEKTYLKGELD